MKRQINKEIHERIFFFFSQWCRQEEGLSTLRRAAPTTGCNFKGSAFLLWCGVTWQLTALKTRCCLLKTTPKQTGTVGTAEWSAEQTPPIRQTSCTYGEAVHRCLSSINPLHPPPHHHLQQLKLVETRTPTVCIQLTKPTQETKERNWHTFQELEFQSSGLGFLSVQPLSDEHKQQ